MFLRGGWILICGVAGVGSSTFFPWFRDDPAQKPSVNTAELEIIESGRRGKDRKHASFDAQTWINLLSSFSLWAIAIGYLGTSFGWSFLVSWMNQFLLDTYRVSYGGSPWLKMLPPFVGGCACLIGGSCFRMYMFGRTAGPALPQIFL